MSLRQSFRHIRLDDKNPMPKLSSQLRRRANLCVAILVAAAAATLETRSFATDTNTAGTAIPAIGQTFLRDHCLDCHSGEDAEGGADLESLLQRTDTAALADEGTFASWVRVYERVRDGEMPPADYGSIDEESSDFPQRQSFEAETHQWLKSTQEAELEKLGRTRGRRLTNQELEATLHDLLAIDVPLSGLLPEEVRHEGFTNIAAAQSMSHFQLEDHLAVVDAALDAAFERANEPESQNRVIDYNARRLARSNPDRRCRDPEMRNGLAVVWNSTMIFYGRITSTTMREGGWYKIRFRASSVKPPEGRGVWCTIRSGRCTSGAPLLTSIGTFEATDEPTEHTYTAWVPKDHMLEIRPADATLKVGRFRGGQVGVGEGEPQNIPGVALHDMSIERLYPGGTPDATRQQLFGEIPVTASKDGLTIHVSGDQLRDALHRQVHRFAEQAARRPLDLQAVEPFQRLLVSELDKGTAPIDTLRGVYRAILCSPRFIYFSEPAGQLDSFAVANRLSYLLWGSMPDDTLWKLAESGRLLEPGEVRRQTKRLLEHPRGRDFVDRFAESWLDLANIDFTEPDRKLYRDFDLVVQNAMLEETRRSVDYALRNNRPAGELVTAGYTFLNGRLAEYYGIDGVDGQEMRRVDLPEDSVRGGLLSHGAILKITANGTNTSPVLRGVWISQRILGQPIAPPPENVPAIEPDIRGATTIREMLAKHKADAACASCHQKIDPPGNALENFDAAGRWRESYIAVAKGKSRKGQPIHTADTLPDGRAFESYKDFQQLWQSTPEPIARCFVEHLLKFATGAEIAFADRETVDEIVASTKQENYGLKSLLHAALDSRIFLHK